MLVARQVNLRLSDELYERVEAARGEMPRERWLRAAVERVLADAALPSPPVVLPANQRAVVQRSFVKRGVGPIPKGKR